MNIIKDFFIELKKHKRRHNMLIFILVILAESAFIYGNYNNKKGIADGWMMLFYNMPIINCLFIPVVIGGFASRITEIEHKGDMLKSLYTFSTPQRIFYTKYLYGALSILALIVLQCFSVIGDARILDFSTAFPFRYMLIYGVCTYITCMTLFTIHMMLAFFFRNQAVNVSVGILGSFVGLFSSFLPKSIFQKLLPWGSFVTSSFVETDWNRDTREVKWYLVSPDYLPIVFCLLWIIILTAVTLFLLQKNGVEDSAGQKYHYNATDYIKMHRRPIEFLKLKGSPAWIAFFIIPVISAAIGTINYLGNLSILKDGWYSLWTQHTLFICYFFMPVIIGIFAGCIWRIEHTGTTMNLLMTLQTPAKTIISKFIATCFITTLSIIWIMILYVFAGKIIHIGGVFPTGITSWLIMGIIGSYTICAFQIFVSLIIRNFILPVIIAFLGGIGGLVCIAKGFPYFTPYSLFDLAMNRQQLGNADVMRFLVSSALFISVFILLSITYLSYSDARSHE